MPVDGIDSLRNAIYGGAGAYWFYDVVVDEGVNNRFKLPMSSIMFQCNKETSELGRIVPSALPMPPNHTHTACVGSVKCASGSTKVGGSEGTTTASKTTWPLASGVYSKEQKTVQPPTVKLETYMRCY